MGFSRAFKGLGLIFLFVFLAGTVSFGQNTKGDKPVSRETRFKTPFKKKKQKRVVSNKRVRSKDRSVAGRATGSAPRTRTSGKDRPGRPIRPLANTQPSSKQKAWRGDLAGYRIRKRSSAGSSRNVYPQYGRYSHNPSKKPKSNEKPVSNRGTLARLHSLESRQSPPGKKRKVIPRSASRSFTARKSINIYANFPRPKRKSEQARTTDLSGRPLRRKNFETPRPGVSAPIFKPYAGRGKMGDKAYSGQVGGYRSATKTRQRAWTGDVAGRRIRGRNFTSKKSVEGQPTLAGRRKTGTKSHPGLNPLPPKGPGIGANGIGGFRGRIRARKPFKGGGSVSGRVWNNNGRSLSDYAVNKSGREALFQGNIKGSRPLKGGGSASGRTWNNNGRSLADYAVKKSGREARFQGNVKAGRPFKGGGSVSGKVWNNKQTPIQGTAIPGRAARVDGYVGKMKRFEVQPGFGDQGERFTGYIKLKKFRKNYVTNPNSVADATKQKRPGKKVFVADGLHVKVKRRDYVENKNTAKGGLLKLRPTKSTTEAGDLHVRVKRPDYVKNKNSAEDALLKLRPSKSTYQAGELQVKAKQAEYGRKPHAAEGSLPGIKPSRSSVKASEYARSVRRTWDYIHNPSSADEAQKTREPGKAFARVSAYQGNIKMHKFTLFEQNRNSHPDTKFIKINKNNVDEERDAVTNFKLWWARLFRKQETQPDGLKYKGRKPRYDKGEAGMWNE